MTAWFFAKLYVLTAGVFFAIDLVWIGGVAADFYQKRLGHLLADSPLWAPALLFYSIYVMGGPWRWARSWASSPTRPSISHPWRF
jgi:uncharacterized membrane protein